MDKHDNEYHLPPVERVLSDLEIFRIAGELRSGCGTPEQARELMAQFVVGAYTNDGPSRELIAFVRDSIAEHLGGKSLAAAFRVKQGRRGRPKVDDAVYIELATELLRYRLESGSLHEDAVAHVREKKHKGRTVVTDAWTNYRENALVRLRDERLEAARKEAEKTAYGDQPLTGDEPHIDLVIGPLWTPGETKILRSIYPDGPL
jgi:hypothetical protein